MHHSIFLTNESDITGCTFIFTKINNKRSLKIPKGGKSESVYQRRTDVTVAKRKNTKGVIRICISKKDRCHRGQKKKYKSADNDLQNIHIKLKIPTKYQG